MAVHVYLDGSGKADSRAVTLTGVAAPQALWAEFQSKWIQALDKSGVPDRDLHMADLMASQGSFSGWDEPRKRSLVCDLWNVIGSFRGTSLRAYSCTVLTSDYKRAKAVFPTLRPLAAICVNYCVGGLHITPEEKGTEDRCVLLYFDRNEPYMHTINRVWLRHRKHAVFMRQILDIIITDRTTSFQVQAADFLAWNVNRYHCETEKQPWRVIGPIIAIEHFTAVYDYERISSEYGHDVWN